jgi:glycosyltransferase involved in cell wall biosynthesis
MSITPFFSIITPTYNRASFLEEMIASVTAQSFQNFEHIIVDDGSTDETEELVNGLIEKHPKIVYIKQDNKGRSVARNVGIEHAKGEYVCFLDSDDVWLPEHLQTLEAAILSQEIPAMFHTGLIWFYENGTTEHLVTYADRNSFLSDVEYVIANEFAPNCVCIHHSILKEHQFDPELYINEDLELWARIAVSYPVKSVVKHTAKLRVHQGNTHNVVDDNVSPRKNAFAKLLGNAEVRKNLSAVFIRNKKRGFLELEIRYLENTKQRWLLSRKLILFLLKYPKTSRNSAKFVILLYNLPGGQLLKSLVASIKSQ